MPIANTLVIGLGGQGSRYVNETKRVLEEEKILQENQEFIAIDSHHSDLSRLDKIAVESKLILQRPPPEIIEKNWPWALSKELDIVGESIEGASNKRAFGRILSLYNLERLESFLKGSVHKLKEKKRSDKYVVIIMCALGGGTGSSLFHEVAVFLRNWLPSIGEGSPTIIGIGTLPKKSEDAITIANTYGALKEIHFVQNLAPPKVVTTAGLSKDYARPFNAYFLLAREIHDRTRDEELKKLICHALIDFGYFPDTKLPFKGKIEYDVGDLNTRFHPYRGFFHTIGYFEVIFPVDKLKFLYDCEDKIPQREQRLEEIKQELIEERRKLDEYEAERKELDAKRENLESDIKVHGKGVLETDEIFQEMLTALSNIKDDLEMLKPLIDDLIMTIRNLEEERDELVVELRKLRALHDAVERDLKHPTLEHEYWTQVKLSEEEISSLRRFRHDFDHMNFKQIMAELGADRADQYYFLTHEPISDLKVIFRPVLDYHFLSKNDLSEREYDILNKYGFVTPSLAGNIIKEDEKLGMVISMLSTRKDNIEEAQLDELAFTKTVEKELAKSARLFPLFADYKRYAFSFYMMLLGLQPWRPAPNLQHRLRSLDWISSHYEHEVQDRRAIIHHSLFLGTPKHWSVVTGERFVPGADRENTENIIKFWVDHEIIDMKVIWQNVPTTLAQVMRVLELVRDLFFHAQALWGNLNVPTQKTTSSLNQLFTDTKKANAQLERFTRQFADANISLRKLIEIISELKEQISEAEEAVTPDYQERVGKLLRDCCVLLEDELLDGLDSLSESLEQDSADKIGDILDFRDQCRDLLKTRGALRTADKLGENTDEAKKLVLNAKVALNNLSTPLAGLNEEMIELRDMVEHAEEIGRSPREKEPVPEPGEEEADSLRVRDFR
jgi:hypothetical protein